MPQENGLDPRKPFRVHAIHLRNPGKKRGLDLDEDGDSFLQAVVLGGSFCRQSLPLFASSLTLFCKATLRVSQEPLVPGHRGIDFARPGIDAADQMLDLAEARLAQQVQGLGAAPPCLAVHDDLARAI